MNVLKPSLIIAGPGAGKTHNMVQTILGKLKEVDACRYIAVITYTNSAAENIKTRLSKLVTPPENLFIGTMHSFLNRFIVIPFASFDSKEVNHEKLFIQCDLEDVFKIVQKQKGKKFTHVEKAGIKSNIKTSLHQKGYITYDQTVALAKACCNNPNLLSIIANRIQYLFVDEFQDTSTPIFSIIENLRKAKRTTIFCVGDPEQYIQGFDSKTKYKNIPILTILKKTTYTIEINDSNRRCGKKIVTFLNLFNSRTIGGQVFQQTSLTEIEGESITFISAYSAAKPILDQFISICEKLEIDATDRCIIAKKNDVVRRVQVALNNNFVSPDRNLSTPPLQSILDTLLSALDLNQTQFYDLYKTNIYTLRRYSIEVMKAIRAGIIKDENSFGKFLSENLNLTLKPGIPIKIDNIKVQINVAQHSSAMTVCNIHTIKGLESKAVLAIAKDESELLKWLEQDALKRAADPDDYSRLGYVAFSRAKVLLCIACLQPIAVTTRNYLSKFNVEIC